MEISKSALVYSPLGPRQSPASGVDPHLRPVEQDRFTPPENAPARNERPKTDLAEQVYQGELLDKSDTEPSLDYGSLIREARLRTASGQTPVGDQSNTYPGQAQRAIAAYESNANAEIGPELLSRIDSFV